MIFAEHNHLNRLMSEYVSYYHEDRTHLGLGQETPTGRKALKARAGGAVISMARLGGLHHRYDLAA